MGSLQRAREEEENKRRIQCYKIKMKKISVQSGIAEEYDKHLYEAGKQASDRDKS